MSTIISEEEFKNEVSLHEASHLVMQILILKEFNSFTKPNKIQLIFEEQGVNAAVFGFVPLNDDGTEFIIDNNYTHYFKPNNAYLKCLSLLSGYYSYKVYINDTETYISSFDHNHYSNTKQFRLKYHRFQNAEIDGTHKINDKKQFYNILSYAGNETKKEKDLLYHQIIHVVDSIMRNNHFDNAVKLVASKLIESESGIIEGEEFSKLYLKIEKVLDEIKITDFVTNEEMQNVINSKS